MKLLKELNEEVNILIEEDQKDPSKKNYYVEGIVLQANVLNGNGRIYPLPIMVEEVARYSKDSIERNKAYGELGHPNTPIINLPLVSHMFKSLKQEGNNFIGKAKLMPGTPNGRIAIALIDEGAVLGISSRGVGETVLKNGQNVIQKFRMNTPGDLVANPSGPDCFVNAVMEQQEWVWDGTLWIEENVANVRQRILNTPKAELNQARIMIFEEFIQGLHSVKNR